MIGFLLTCLLAIWHPLQAQSALDGFDPDVDGTVHAIARLDDGKLLIGGDFTSVGGVFQTRLARLNPDGSRDSSFGNPVTGGSVRVIHVAPNGDVLIGGENLSVTDLVIPMGALFRIKADGSIDLSFKPVETGLMMAITDDGSEGFYLGGLFSTVAGQPREFFARINAEGQSISGNLLGVNGLVSSVVRDSETGAIYVCGDFTQLGGLPVGRIARLHNDNVRDVNFSASADGTVFSMRLTRNGDLLVGGVFANINGRTQPRFARLSPKGALRTDYPGSPDIHTVNAVAERSDGKLLLAGEQTVFGGGVLRQLDSLGNRTDVISLDEEVNAMLVLTGDHLILGGRFTDTDGISRNRVARIDAHGEVDTTLEIQVDSGQVTAAAQLLDRNWVIGGDFTAIDGAARAGLARIDSAGALLSPLTGTANAQLNGVPLAIAVQPDGRVIIGGTFTSAFGASVSNLIRTNSEIGIRESVAQFAATPNNTVRAVTIQPDGKILIGGDFSQVGGLNRAGIARLNADGTPDTTFNALLNGGAVVRAIALQRDGKVVIGGTFSSASGTLRNHLARVNGAGGVLDTTFDPNPNGRIDTLLLQPDGDILVGGEFTTVGATSRVRVARLNGDGSVDTGFNASLSSAAVARVSALALQADDRVLIGGSNGLITRRLDNGASDPTFAVSANGSILGISLGVDGKIVLNGNFSSLSGQARPGLARLSARDRDALFSFTYDDVFGRVIWGIRDSAGQVVGSPVLWVSTDTVVAPPGAPAFVVFERLGEMSRLSSLWRLNVALGNDEERVFRVEYQVAGGSAGASLSTMRVEHLRTVRLSLFANGFE